MKGVQVNLLIISMSPMLPLLRGCENSAIMSLTYKKKLFSDEEIKMKEKK